MKKKDKDKETPLAKAYADELEGVWEPAYHSIWKDGMATTAVFIDELAKHVFSAEGAAASDEELDRSIDSAYDLSSAEDRLLSKIILWRLSEAVGDDVVREWAEEGRRKILAEKDVKEADWIITEAWERKRKGKRCTRR